MPAPLFIVPPDALKMSSCLLPPEEAHHALQVLRLKAGDEVQLTDGKGSIAAAAVYPERKKKMRVEITGMRYVPPYSPRIRVYLGILKARQRLETALEKLTETGVEEIVLMDTAHTERQKFRMNRASAVVTSAVKQSQSAWMPALRYCSFKEAIQQVENTCSFRDILVAAHEKQDIRLENGRELTGRSFAEIRAHILEENATFTTEAAGNRRFHIFIGPEGGFSPEEVSVMLSFSPVMPLWLGAHRLRAETAAIQTAGLFRFGL